MFMVLPTILFGCLLALVVLCVLAFLEGAFGTDLRQSEEAKNSQRPKTEESQTTAATNDDYRVSA